MTLFQGRSGRQLRARVMEERLPAMLCFPMFTPAPGVRQSAQRPTVGEALRPGAESCGVPVQHCWRREVAHDGCCPEDPPTRLPRRQRIRSGDLFAPPTACAVEEVGHKLHALRRTLPKGSPHSEIRERRDPSLCHRIDHRQLVVGDLLSLHRVLSFNCPEPRTQLPQHLQRQPLDLPI